MMVTHGISNISNNNISQHINREENKNKFDDIPIKPSNKTNFLELLEKNLAEGQYNDNENNEKKKIIKHERFKKEIKVSAPGKTKKI